MTKRKPIQTSEELVHAFANLFDEVGPTTQEDIEQVLYATGHDPDEIAAKMKGTAERAFSSALQRWRQETSEKLQTEREQIASFQSTPVVGRENVLSAIRRLDERLGGQVALAYRNLESETDDSLLSLLHNLEYLASQQGSKDKE